MNLSFWEREYYQFEQSIVILGAGFTGLSTALSILDRDAHANIIIVDRSLLPQGASTKNAGFSCFGSITELLDDLQKMPVEQCIELIKMRKSGIEKHLERCSENEINYHQEGGYELLSTESDFADNEFKFCNEMMQEVWHVPDYFKMVPQTHFNDFYPLMVSAEQEGSLNPVLMLNALYEQCLQRGVKFAFGIDITDVNEDKKTFTTRDNEHIPYKKLVICLNGFAANLLNLHGFHVVRNQVLITKPIIGLEWSGVYHYEQGYYYFRRVGHRILLGGARNIDEEGEITDEFGNTKLIMEVLESFLRQKILGGTPYQIDQCWSGLLGVGEDKFPIIRQLGDVYIGVKLGGMGVALSGYIGEELAKMLTCE
ncbi:MAG TPA: FAD-dependent oxidoreductase [Saprospiraceae bacterium]|nr:FAD-dependent oxidoreductase [Saprospiraceae bacterium]